MAGSVPVAAAFCQPWAAEMARRRIARRPSAHGVSAPARCGLCARTKTVVIRYDLPEGGRVTVWNTVTGSAHDGQEEGGPW
ncbi:hypothetical protein OG625_40335 (plasmid) [Streptomyces sp. NBC_01351]|uniref:hypothetical protein n=1 Tax=Streptomyces sp. NBC_01351 TaxID=2903833 RepID=UPI002E353BD3|nr:hypothetical protein [Streptomyces sp. NBC_01351]